MYIGVRRKRLSREQLTKGLGADLPAADVLVAIDARAELALAVVEVNRHQPRQPQQLVELPPERQIAFAIAQVVAGGEGVAGIDADAAASRAASTALMIAASCSSFQPRHVPWPAVISSAIWALARGSRR